jgi:hypothetical protein
MEIKEISFGLRIWLTVLMIMVLVTLVGIFYQTFISPPPCPEYSELERNLKKEYKGIVIDKFVNCYTEYLEIKFISNNLDTIKVFFYKHHSCLLNDLQRGDSIYKKENSLNVELIRDGISKIYTYDCSLDSCKCINYFDQYSY